MHALKKCLFGFSGYFGKQTDLCCVGRSGSNDVAKILQFVVVLQHVAEKR
jgi:hypothetical protein